MASPVQATLVGPVGAFGTRFYAGVLRDGESATFECTPVWCPTKQLCFLVETSFTFEVRLVSPDGGRLVVEAPDVGSDIGKAQLIVEGPVGEGAMTVTQRDDCMEASVAAFGAEPAVLLVKVQSDLY